MQKNKLYKSNFILVTLFTVIISTYLIYFGKAFFKDQDEKDYLRMKKIDGHLITLKDEGRGSYFLEIETINDTVSIHSLPISWEIREYQIEVGDSVSKSANSKIIHFYRLQKGVYTKYCEYEI